MPLLQQAGEQHGMTMKSTTEPAAAVAAAAVFMGQACSIGSGGCSGESAFHVPRLQAPAAAAAAAVWMGQAFGSNLVGARVTRVLCSVLRRAGGGGGGQALQRARHTRSK